MPRFEIVTEPIDRWPEPDTVDRKWSPFDAKYEQTMQLLRKELDMIDAKDRVVLQLVTRRGAADLRRDGMVRADAQVDHPGVRLSIPTVAYGDLTYATDKFYGSNQRPAWQQNLRAIALGLEALRKVDRYGISKSGEQYRGWLQIEGAGPDLNVARSIIWTYATGNELTATPAQANWAELHRQARIATHPDVMGGMRGAWDEVEAAAKLLGLL